MAHIPQFFLAFRREAILYCRAINKLYFANPLAKGFCEKCKCKLRNVGFMDYRNFLSTLLRDLETSGHVSFPLQTKTEHVLQRKVDEYLRVDRLLLYFGLIYTAGIVLLWLLGM